MAMQRANPLPAGRYWVDVFVKDQPKFRAWLSTNKATVHVDQTKSTGVGDMTKDAQGNAAVDSYLFTVKAPTKWEGPGYATIAGPEIKSLDDTSQMPEPELDWPEKIDKALPSLEGLRNVGGTVAKVGMGIVVVAALGVAGWFAVKAFSAHRAQAQD